MNKNLQFQFKLYNLVEENCEAVKWNNGGKTIIFDFVKFKDVLISRWRTQKLSSFIRNLNLYNFKLVGSYARHCFVKEYFNPKFVKGCIDNLELITRRCRKTAKKKKNAKNGNKNRKEGAKRAEKKPTIKKEPDSENEEYELSVHKKKATELRVTNSSIPLRYSPRNYGRRRKGISPIEESCRTANSHNDGAKTACAYRMKREWKGKNQSSSNTNSRRAARMQHNEKTFFKRTNSNDGGSKIVPESTIKKKSEMCKAKRADNGNQTFKELIASLPVRTRNTVNTLMNILKEKEPQKIADWNILRASDGKHLVNRTVTCIRTTKRLKIRTLQKRDWTTLEAGSICSTCAPTTSRENAGENCQNPRLKSKSCGTQTERSQECGTQTETSHDISSTATSSDDIQIEKHIEALNYCETREASTYGTFATLFFYYDNQPQKASAAFDCFGNQIANTPGISENLIICNNIEPKTERIPIWETLNSANSIGNSLSDIIYEYDIPT